MSIRNTAMFCMAMGSVALLSTAEARDRHQQVLIEARFIAVSSGDAMQVLADSDIRDLILFGVSTPSGDEPFAAEARSFTRTRVSGKELPVRIIDTDEYGRLIGDVRLPGDRSLGLELLTEGLGAWNHLENPDPAWGAAETEARLARRGIWQIPQLGRLPTLGGPGSDVDSIVEAILRLSPGDQARLSSRLGGGQGGTWGPSRTIITTRDGAPVHHQDGARIIRRSSGRSSDFGIGFDDDGIRLRGGATERQRTDDTSIQVFGPSNGTLIIEEEVPHISTVYVDDHGVFHRPSCFGDRPLGHAHRRDRALARGYRPCSRCRP